jgi:hypothetical protein
MVKISKRFWMGEYQGRWIILENGLIRALMFFS